MRATRSIEEPAVAGNLLPWDGAAYYVGRILGLPEARRYFEALFAGIPWAHDETVMFGRRIVTARKVAWYGDAGYAYAYSGTTKRARAWTPELCELKARVEERSGARFNSCLLNLYHSGDEGMGWHSDDERSLGRDAPIASLSLGAEREFRFRHRESGATISVVLEDGSLLVMKDATQRHWLHSLPKAKRVRAPRINLTFRTMVEGAERRGIGAADAGECLRLPPGR